MTCRFCGMENRQTPRTTKGSPENRPAESLGSAEANRVTPIVNVDESLCDSDSTESIATGATTPPMKPTFHGRGGGAALSVATTHAPLSVTSGSSAFCTVPFRPKSVTDAGCGIAAIAAEVFVLSGSSTNVRFGVSVATSKTGPASGSQVGAEGAALAESARGAGALDAESADGALFARSHALRNSAARMTWERRNSFIRRNLDPPTSPSTVIPLD